MSKDNIADSIFNFLHGVSKTVWWTLVVIFAIVIGVIAFFYFQNRGNRLTLTADGKIDITPTQIRSIQEIGQWEFLSVNDEELVDTVSRGFLSESELSRIYYGTVRIGVDLHKAKPQWIKVRNDSILSVTLPDVALLDRNFIDEARTRSFYESGDWKSADREALYRKAYQQMLKRCLTPENLRIAREHAKEEFTKLFRSMGYRNVEIEFENSQK